MARVSLAADRTLLLSCSSGGFIPAASLARMLLLPGVPLISGASSSQIIQARRFLSPSLGSSRVDQALHFLLTAGRGIL